MMEKYFLFTMLLKPIFGRPGTITAMSTFGEIMEDNMRSILYSPDEATSQVITFISYYFSRLDFN